MDKPRHPHVIRTWVVNKVRTPRLDQPVQPIPHERTGPLKGFRKPPVTGASPKAHDS
jgi:hypothetical protein